ncbi:MAG: DeoR/GlpR family DNA-binding transcription regulator [Byssovorax cruenta]|jgi:DeoR/GlpR family transcriptional regulator of sugar metabolism
MLKKERQRKILEIIERSGKVEVEQLANTLAVSVMTVRRDLTELDKLGFLERVHGGALLPHQKNGGEELPVIERSKEKTEIKERIARAVAGLTNDGEKIFLGSGSTTATIASALLHHRDLTVFTNAINISNILMAAPHIKVAVIGGFLRKSELSLIGYFAENALRGLQVDKVIIGIRGIDPVKGLTSDNMEELITDQAIMNLSKTVIVAADNSKFGHVAAIRTAPITAVTKIITNFGGPKDVLQAIRHMGIQIIEV